MGRSPYDVHNTYWNLPDRHFVRDLDPRIRNYIIFALGRQIRADFLRALDSPLEEDLTEDRLNSVHHVWETSVWLEVSAKKVVKRNGTWRILPEAELRPGDHVLEAGLRPCKLSVRDDARIAFELGPDSNVEIFTRRDPIEYQAALRDAWPALWRSFKSARDA